METIIKIENLKKHRISRKKVYALNGMTEIKVKSAALERQAGNQHC